MSIVAIVAIIGAIITAGACIRALMALKRNEGRDAVIGWFSIMVAAAVFVFALDRVTSS